jgi:PTH1 family peptidyl-tRNA hydrolase
MVNGVVRDTRVIAIKPTTFMNLSGEAVQAVMHFYKIPNSQVVVVHDELDIPFGQIRTRMGGSSAGNNGVKSLIQHLGEDFARVRIGIRNDLAEKQDSAAFVLDKFSKEEKSQLSNLKKEVTSILTEYVYGNQLSAETRSFIL